MKKKIINYRPIVFGFLAMLLSIVTITESKYNVIYLSILLMFTLFFIFITLVKRKWSKYLFVGVCMLIGVISTTVFGYYLSANKVSGDISSIQGRISEVRKYGYVLDDVIVANERLGGKVLVKTDEELSLGDIVYTYEHISNIEFDANDGFITSLYDDGIYYLLKTTSIAKTKNGKITLSERIKLSINNLYSKYMREDGKGIAMGMLLGDTTSMTDELRDGISNTGLSHIFAVSGLHIGFLTGIVLFINRKLRIKRMLNMLLTLVVLILYNLLCGFSPSMVRATIMSVIVLFSREMGYKMDGLSSLALAGILIATFKPYSVFTISFQMSFLAVFGIIAFSKMIKFKRIPKWANDLIALSLGVNFAIFPLVAFWFKKFALLFLPVNFIIMPFMPLIYSITALFTVIGLIPGLEQIVIAIDYVLLPIKFVTIAVNSLAINTLNIAFTKTAMLFCLSAQGVLTRQVMLKTKTKALITALFFILGLFFILIQL